MASSSSSIMDLFALHGKTAIITGATGGLGLVLALTLAEAGADIVSVQFPNDPAGPSLKEAVEGLQRKFSVFECNIADSASIRNAFAAIWEAGIVPDILLHCAGITRIAKIEDTPDDYIDAVRRSTINSAVVC